MACPAARRPTALAAVLLLTLAGCAGRGALAPSGDGPSAAARAALDALLVKNDAASAAAALAGRPAAVERDPWALLARALLARRALDAPAELAALARLAEAAPDHPLALAALRRLGELPEGSPELARAVEAAVAPLTGSGRLTGLAAFRARVARIAAAEALGEVERVAALRAENGAVTAWSLSGPHALLHAVDFDAPTAPELGTLPASLPDPLLGLPRPTRPLPAPDGLISLEGEPADGDQYVAAAEVTLARGGRYLAILGSTGSARAWLDGAPLAERRAFDGPAPGQLIRPLELPAGGHRVLLKLARAGGRSAAILHLVRADGAPSDLTARAPAPGALPPVAPGPFPPPAFGARELAAALEPGGPLAARLVAARDAMTGDLEGAKALLEEALGRQPASAALLTTRGLAHDEDPTLDEQIGNGRAEQALRAALQADPGAGDARLALAELLRRTDRAADADDLLAAFPDDQARRPAALALRARVAEDRGFPEVAEGLAEAARAAGGSCEATRLAAELATRREAVARKDELEHALLGCRGGRERLASHLSARGDAAGALALLEPVTRVRPAAVQPALARARALAAAGDPAAAARSLQPALDAWPRWTQLMKAQADQLELAGDAAGARAQRERALAQDGADLTLRRALALEGGGAEPLADEAIDGLAAIRDYLAAPRREDASSVLVLDAAAIEFHAGGASTERVHQVFRVLDQQAVDHQGEAQVPPGAQRLSLRTVKADGRILEPEEGEGKGAASLAGLEPGDFVEMEFLRGVPAGRPAAGVAAEPFYFATPGTSMFRSTYLVRAPVGFGLTADAHGMAPVATVVEGGREVVRHEATEVPALVPEPGGPAPQEWLPFLHVGTGGGREVAQRLLADSVADRTGPTLELRALAAGVRARVAAAGGAGATGPEALARAAYEEVRRQVVGQGGSFGEDASAVLSRGRGSRLTLLKALLDLLGVKARFAALRPFGNDQTPYRFPGPGLWAHPVLRVEWPGGGAWLDPALRQQPFGFLPERALDAEALLVPAPGEPLTATRTPAENPRPEQRELDLRLALDADGGAAVEGTDRYAGALGAGAKASLERLDQAARRQAVEQLLTRSLRGIRLTELSIEGEEDPEAPLVMRWKGTATGLTRDGGGAVLVDAPLLAARLGARFVRLAARTTPLLVDATERSLMRLTVAPPPGLSARPAAPERLEGPFGRFERTERLEGGALVREDRLELRRARVDPADYPAFAAFAGGVDEVQARPVAFPRAEGR